MDAETVFVWREKLHHGCVEWQLVPTAAVNEQAMLRTQFARGHIHQAHMTTMCVEQQYFFHASTRD